MGDGHTGGGGSVQWKIDMRKEKRHGRKPGSRTVVSGADYDGLEGKDFTISIDLDGEAIGDFKARINDVGGRAVFTLPIRYDPKGDPQQIHIHWDDGVDEPLARVAASSKSTSKARSKGRKAAGKGQKRARKRR